MSRPTLAPCALIALALVLTGCGTAAQPGAGSPVGPGVSVGPSAFAAAVRDPATVTLNVHVPDEGSIAGTDLSIPFDRLRARRAELPPPSTPLTIYCRSGRMSAIAMRTLAGLGYRRVTELRGGMIAWRESGRSLLPPARTRQPLSRNY